MPSRVDWFEYIRSRMYDMVMKHINEYKGTRDEFGNTGLICAVLNNDIHMVRILVSHEAGIISVTGKTALHVAISTKSSEICYILAPYEWNTTDAQGKTTLMMAAEHGTLDIVILLAPYFGNERDASGFSALDIAIVKNRRDIIDFLLCAQNLTLNDLQIASTITKSYGDLQIASVLDKNIRERLSIKCDSCRALIARVNCQAKLISYMKRLIEALYQGQSVDAAVEGAPSVSPPIPETAQGISPSRREANSVLSIAPPVPRHETPGRSSSSLVPPNYPSILPNLSADFECNPVPLQYSISAPPMAQASQALCIPNFHDLAMNFQLLSANYAQMKERHNHKHAAARAGGPLANNNVFAYKGKGTLGGDDWPESNTSGQYSPNPNTPTGRRKSLQGVSPRGNRLGKKQYMELNAAPLVHDMDDCAASFVKDPPLPDTPRQQHVPAPGETIQPITLPAVPDMEKYEIPPDVKDNVFLMQQWQGVPRTPGETTLMRAARENDLNMARSVLAQEARRCLPDGTTALMLAVKHRSLELTHLLSSNEVQMQDSEGKTALHYAAETDWVDGFKALYYQECDIKTPSGRTAADIAREHNSITVLAYIKELSRIGNQDASSSPKPKPTPLLSEPSKARTQEGNDKAVPKSRRIEDIIDFYKAEANHQRSVKTPTNRQLGAGANDAAIPPSVSLSTYDMPSPQRERERSSVQTQNISSDPYTNLDHSPPPRSDLLVRVGSNLRGISDMAPLPKRPSSNLGPDNARPISQQIDTLTKERMKTPMRSRNNSANVKSHSPLASGKSELMVCVENDDFEMGKNLIEAQSGRGDRTGNTALMYAARYNRSNFATALVKYEAGFVNDDDQTAYEIAMSLNNYVVAGILRPHEKHLQKGSPERRLSLKLNDPDTQLRTVIVEESDSVFNGIPASANSSTTEEILQVPQRIGRHAYSTQDLTIEMLLTQNTNNPPINNEPCSSNSPIDPHVLKPRGNSESNPLIESVKSGDLAGVKRHLQEHSGMVDLIGLSALMYAAELGNADAVMILRSTEAKIRVPQYSLRTFYDLHNGTALMIATAKKNGECVRALIPYEAGLTDDEGLTALMIAARYAYTDIIASLIPKEAGILNSNGQTALMIAVQNNLGSSHLEAIKALCKVEKRRTDKSGVTALIWAAFSGQIEVVKLLMDEAGMATNANHSHGAGFTAIMAAAQAGATAIVELLFPIEGKMVQQNGKTVKDWAKTKGVKDLLSMIL